jgi:hypothetical protein
VLRAEITRLAAVVHAAIGTAREAALRGEAARAHRAALSAESAAQRLAALTTRVYAALGISTRIDPMRRASLVAAGELREVQAWACAALVATAAPSVRALLADDGTVLPLVTAAFGSEALRPVLRARAGAWLQLRIALAMPVQRAALRLARPAEPHAARMRLALRRALASGRPALQAAATAAVGQVRGRVQSPASPSTIVRLLFAEPWRLRRVVAAAARQPFAEVPGRGVLQRPATELREVARQALRAVLGGHAPKAALVEAGRAADRLAGALAARGGQAAGDGRLGRSTGKRDQPPGFTGQSG